MKPFKEIIEEEVVFQMEGETGPLTVAHQAGERVEDAEIFNSESSNVRQAAAVSTVLGTTLSRFIEDVRICFRRGQRHTGVHCPEAP